MAKEKDGGEVKVRVLLTHGDLVCNTVVTLDKETAAVLKRDGLVDDDAAAVAACEAGA